MGTNYYATPQPCPHCGRTDERVHIGKSSVGWVFALMTHPDIGINTLDDWKAYLVDKVITDEYGRNHTVDELLAVIVERSWRKRPDVSGAPPLGYSSWSAYLAMNQSEIGPNNLLRHRIDGRHCIGHGEGTWDYMKGEFS